MILQFITTHTRERAIISGQKMNFRPEYCTPAKKLKYTFDPLPIGSQGKVEDYETTQGDPGEHKD